MFDEKPGDESSLSGIERGQGDFNDEVVGLFALDDAFELGLGGGSCLGGMELGDYITGEALLELNGVDGAGCHGLFDFGDIVVRDVCDEFQVVEG